MATDMWPVGWDIYVARCLKCGPQSAQGQSALQPASALNPLRANMQSRGRWSVLELRGPKNDLKTGP
eukprot:2850776-Alexandrium_andersonii.AAC.1